jgi:luciferase family oxidoreductase group 1
VGGGQFPTADDFPQRVWELVGHLDNNLPDDHPSKRVRLQPEGPGAPQVWLLGSSDFSGVLAAQLGLRFAFAHFINAQGGDVVMRYFKDNFTPSAREKTPQALLCCAVICGETDAEAERMAKVVDLRRLEMAYNLDTPVPTLEMAEARAYTEPELAHIRSQRPRLVFGSAATCKAKLEELAAQYAADELMILTITGDYPSRVRSYERLAEAFGLQAS